MIEIICTEDSRRIRKCKTNQKKETNRLIYGTNNKGKPTKDDKQQQTTIKNNGLGYDKNNKQKPIRYTCNKQKPMNCRVNDVCKVHNHSLIYYIFKVDDREP